MEREYDTPHWADFLFVRDTGEEHRILCSQCGEIILETSNLDGIKLLIPRMETNGVKTIKPYKKRLIIKFSSRCPHCGSRMGIKSRRLELFI